jgi:hypothetical protein
MLIQPAGYLHVFPVIRCKIQCDDGTTPLVVHGCTTTTSVKWIQRRSHSDVCPPTEGRVGEADLIIPSSVHIDTLRRSQRAILFSPSSRRGWRNPIPIPSALPPLAEGSGISARACRNVCATAAAPGATVNARRRTGRARARARRPAHERSLHSIPILMDTQLICFRLLARLFFPIFPPSSNTFSLALQSIAVRFANTSNICSSPRRPRGAAGRCDGR